MESVRFNRRTNIGEKLSAFAFLRLTQEFQNKPLSNSMHAKWTTYFLTYFNEITSAWNVIFTTELFWYSTLPSFIEVWN